MGNRFYLALALADAVLAAAPEAAAESLARAQNEKKRAWTALATSLKAKFSERWHIGSRYEVARTILHSRVFRKVWVIRRYELKAGASAPARVSADVPALPTLKALESWLGLDSGQLTWLTSFHEHYWHRWVRKRSLGQRLLEIPKKRLRTLQRKILHEILDVIPLHPCAHGFRRGHSILTNASPHLGQPLVMNFDLKDFFLTLDSRRVRGVFAMVGYSVSVARALGALCTSLAYLRDSPLNWLEEQVYRLRHLPQGSPASPALANLCAFRLDIRLEGLARKLGATYTRYADDLTFSGPRHLAGSFLEWVPVIALEEGFEVNHRKTSLMRASRRQSVTGIVVNQRPNVKRRDYDILKATLHNCARHGPTAQNRQDHPDFRAHLQGRVAHFLQVNRARGEKLLAIYSQINWSVAR